MQRASQLRKSVLESNDNINKFIKQVDIKPQKKNEKDNSDSDEDEKHDHDHDHENKNENKALSGNDLTPYLLLLALSFHGLFEGIALGLQKNAKSSISLLLAILAHKWAEAITLGVSFTKANVDKKMFLKMISIFSVFTPVGIGIGMILSAFPAWVTSTFMSLSVGTFIYIGAAEIIVEEFSITRFKWQKFIAYLLGGLFITGLTVWEVVGGDE